ncbi:hypothetical protein JIN81_11550 [Haloferula rosea]|uniref:HEAT repeat domain-containing protein n=2 Tax=Haloferula rosea TaxID=490093 RepID=A0A934VG27_9BACT|nr:hypothetical protein [Haloferula rosea]
MMAPPMENPNLEPEMVSIRCPGCGQRFKVSPELEGKMVECGSCDHRFRVGEEVTIRSKKFYPGERKDPSLERFGRVPLQSGPAPQFEAAPMSMVQEHQAEPHVFVEPVSPQRVILGFAGVIGAAIVALIMVFGGSPGGMLDGAPMSNRLVLVGFTSLVASLLVFIANRHQRLKAVLGSLAIFGCLMPLPFVFRQGLPTDTTPVPMPLEPAGGLTSEGIISIEEDPYAELKSEIGYSKLAEALEVYGADGVSQGKTAVGVWVRDIRLFNLDQVFNFLVRSTGASAESWSYPRPPSDHLVVLRDVPPGLTSIAELCDEFGSVERVIDELNLIEVKVDNQTFLQGELDKMQDPGDPSFYELNRRELESIDLQRAQSAVKRLVEVEPKLYRSDIVKRLQELFEEGDLSMKRDVARALINWAADDDGSIAAVRIAASELQSNGEEVPDSVIQFLVKKRDEGSIDLIHALWLKEPQDWEALYGDLGAMIEPSLLSGFESYDPLAQLSAVRLLARVGTSAALPALKKAREDASAEVRVSMDRAIDVISKREP